MQTAVANERTKIKYVCLYTERTSLLYYNFLFSCKEMETEKVDEKLNVIYFSILKHLSLIMHGIVKFIVLHEKNM